MARNTVDPFDEFVTERRPGGIDGCKVARTVAALPPERQAAAIRALAVDPQEQSHSSIVRVLRRWGHPVGDSAVKLHRSGICCCAKADGC